VFAAAPRADDLFHKPRGVVTTRSDPDRRRTIYDVLGDDARGLIPVGRLDLATRSAAPDHRHAARELDQTDPKTKWRRIYAVTVRGALTPAAVAQLPVTHAVLRKSSARESHLIVELHEERTGRCAASSTPLVHEVTR